MPPEILNSHSSQSVTVCLDATVTTDGIHDMDGDTTSPTISLIGKSREEELSEQQRDRSGNRQDQNQVPSRDSGIQPEEYIKRIEDRIFFLEEKFRVLKHDVSPTPVRPSTPVAEPEPAPPPEKRIEPKINRLPLPKRVIWRGQFHDNPKPGPVVFAMDAYWRDFENSPIARTGSYVGNKQEANRWSIHPTGTEAKSPERVRINSPVIIKFLSDVLGESISESTTFVYPFKPFISHEKEIRKRVKKAGEDIELDLNLLDERKDDDVADEETGTEGEVEKPTVGPDDLAYYQCLIEFMDKDMTPIWELREKIRHDNSLKSIAYTDLWHLFTPGELIAPAKGGKNQLFRVVHAVGARRYLSDRYLYTPVKGEEQAAEGEHSVSGQLSYSPTHDRLSPFCIDCIYLDFDGKLAGAVRAKYIIRSFEGMRPITSLPVYPARYAEGEMDKFRKRGKKFASLTRVRHQHYNGLSLDEPREEIDSQVIVDPALAFLNRSDWMPSLGVTYSFFDGDGKEVSDNTCLVKSCSMHPDYYIFDDNTFEKKRCEDSPNAFTRSKPIEKLVSDELSLLCGRTHGFVLRSRKWNILDLGSMQDVVMRSDGFNSLVLPEGHKELVQALVVAHARGRAASGTAEEHQVDLVRGKGKGLIILLHGVPGVGKTSTAECVADLTKRPLFPVTCGNIGETASEVEENLEKNFQLAHKWGCVLLLDEADVFLQKRDKSDMKRNSLVSVFLRVLEYYSGILFLTTNRVGNFDEAFKSRIHISLYYPALDKRSTLKVWKMNLERTKKGKGNMEINESEIIAFAKHHYATSGKVGRWNGRQIRNAFQTAIALAEYEANPSESKGSHGEQRTPKLRKGHFEKVAEASAEFNHYLVEVYSGNDDSRRAELDEVRQDDYKGYKLQPRTKAVGPSKQPQRLRFNETEEEEESSSFSDSGDDDDDNDDGDSCSGNSASRNGSRKRKTDNGRKGKTSTGKSVAGKSAKGGKKARRNVSEEEEESEPEGRQKSERKRK